jgi:hypothetical protein
VICSRYEVWVALLGVPAQRGVDDVSWGLGPGDIVNGAVKANQSIAAFLERLEPYRSIGAPVPQLDDQARAALSSRIADRHDLALLLSVDEYGVDSFVDTVTPLRLVQVAGRLGWTLAETHERLTPLVPLGLTLDYRPDACDDRIVSWQDLLLITEHLDGQRPAISGRVGTDHLTAGAGEVGETVAQVRDRLGRFAALFDLTLPLDLTLPRSDTPAGGNS